MNNSTVISFVNINKQPIEVLHNIDELINKIENCKKMDTPYVILTYQKLN